MISLSNSPLLGIQFDYESISRHRGLPLGNVHLLADVDWANTRQYASSGAGAQSNAS